VTPTISAEGTSVMLKISIESSSIGQKPAGAVDLVTNKRTITTTVLIEDGGVVVLGGLIEDNSVKASSACRTSATSRSLGCCSRRATPLRPRTTSSCSSAEDPARSGAGCV